MATLRVKVDEVDGNIRVSGQTYTIREDLKEAGARWNHLEKSWDFSTSGIDLEGVQRIVNNLVDNRKKRKEEEGVFDQTTPKKQKKDEFKKEYELKPYLDDAKELWNRLMDENNIKKQKALLEGAGIYVKYYKKGKFDAEWHRLIDYKDPKLSKFADQILEYFQTRDIPCTHRQGTKYT